MMKEKSRLFHILGSILVLLLLVLTISTAVDIRNKIKEGRYIGQEIESKNTITVSGQGEVYAKPDLAVIEFSVVTEKETVEEALNVNQERMNKIIKEFKDRGIKEEDLKTTTFNIYPRYEWHEASKWQPEGERTLVGYEVRQSLQVKIRSLEEIGEIIQQGTEAGANQIGNVQFTIEEKEELKKEAREEAIRQAKSKAQDISSQLDVNLIRIINFSESISGPILYRESVMATGLGGAEGTPEIEPGQNKIESNVNISYEIK